MTDISPIRREVLVDATPAIAFDVFTQRIATWWPLDDKSVHGPGSSVAFVDGTIIETSSGKPDVLWGTVTRWEPPGVLAFTWHPGSGPERASLVTVTFAPVGERTLVRLEHAGWEVFDDPPAMRAAYDEGWPVVLDCYVAAAGCHQGLRPRS
jgi:hypothetical protein